MDNYSLQFSLSPVGARTFQRLIKIYGNPENTWKEADKKQFKEAGIGNAVYNKFQTFKRTFDIDEYLQKLKKARVEFVSYFDKEYPNRLKTLKDPPIGIFIRGNKNLLNEKNNIGVVGSRKITSYGAQITADIVADLAKNGLVIISGMAMGVDAAAHKSAIDNRGLTIAVLGCGVDCPYPRENERLYEEIIDSKGLVISEYPLGMPANRGTFPSRNRIIAALSMGILITEAAEGSGSLITAEYAKQSKKPVFAVPGPITSQVSKGVYRLLKEGAFMVGSAEEILTELKVGQNFHESSSGQAKGKIESQMLKSLNKAERKIVGALENEDKTIDDISKETKITVSDLTILLSAMELSGLIKNSTGRWGLIL